MSPDSVEGWHSTPVQGTETAERGLLLGDDGHEHGGRGCLRGSRWLPNPSNGQARTHCLQCGEDNAPHNFCFNLCVLTAAPIFPAETFVDR